MRTSHTARAAEAMEAHEDKMMEAATPVAASEVSATSSTEQAPSAQVATPGGEDATHDSGLLQPRGPGDEEEKDADVEKHPPHDPKPYNGEPLAG